MIGNVANTDRHLSLYLDDAAHFVTPTHRLKLFSAVKHTSSKLLAISLPLYGSQTEVAYPFITSVGLRIRGDTRIAERRPISAFGLLPPYEQV
jgi:hypothetical protein